MNSNSTGRTNVLRVLFSGNSADRTVLHRLLFSFFMGGISLIVLSGCATPRIVFTKEGASFKDYKRVYLLSGDKEKDPRGLVPIVAGKLRELGFYVKEMKSGEPFEGAQGTGFIISPEGHILTAEHVLAKEKRATVWLQGDRIETEVVCSDKDKDLALLKPTEAPNDRFKPLRIDFDAPAKMGQDVYTIGFPLTSMLGRSPRLTKGLVSSTVGLKDDPDHLQVSVEIQSGNSGGPLLDVDGAVVGVLQATLNPLRVLQQTGGTLPQNVNFAAKPQVVKSFLDACPAKVMPGNKKSGPQSFDVVKNSIVQVYSGLISADFITEPKMLGRIYYQYFWDLFYRLRVFQIEFYDYDTGDLLLKAGQYRDNPVSTERGVIDKTFEIIKRKMKGQLQESKEKQAESAPQQM